MSETPRVEEFIRAKQQQVLTRAVSALESPEADLSAEVHRLIGTLGTYSLDDAVAALRPLDALLKAEPAQTAEISAARESALATLRELQTARGDGA